MTFVTKSTIGFFATPSFHEGRLCARLLKYCERADHPGRAELAEAARFTDATTTSPQASR